MFFLEFWVYISKFSKKQLSEFYISILKFWVYISKYFFFFSEFCLYLKMLTFVLRREFIFQNSDFFSFLHLTIHFFVSVT